MMNVNKLKDRLSLGERWDVYNMHTIVEIQM